MSEQSITYRMIAEKAGVSIASVSFALNNRAGVSPKTRKHIQAIADEMGYQQNPLIRALMVGHRRRGGKLKAIIGIITPHEIHSKYYWHDTPRDYLQGAREGAGDLGYAIEEFSLQNLTGVEKRLNKMFKARQLHGLLLHDIDTLPTWLNLDQYAMVALGTRNLMRVIDGVSTNHSENLVQILVKLTLKGYRKIGIAQIKNDLSGEWLKYLGAYSAFTWGKTDVCVPLEPLFLDNQHFTATRLLEWAEKHSPEVVITNDHRVLDWLRNADFRVPEDIGVVHTDVDSHMSEVSGINQNNRKVGYCAVELLADLLNRNVFGIPKISRQVLLEGAWHEGKTVR